MNSTLGLELLRSEFSKITGLSIEEWYLEPKGATLRSDARLRAGNQWFIIEFKAAATTEQISSAISQLTVQAESLDIPLLVVPYMGKTGQELCRAAGIAWLDLSGNAEITTPSLRIRILGEPDRYKRAGRPESLFAPKSARVARQFLLDVQREWLQKQLAEATELSASYLSRLLPRYEAAGFIQQRNEGRTLYYQVTQPNALLDAWDVEYDFKRHRILRGHVASQNGVKLVKEITSVLNHHGVKYAATGLASAWMWEPFAAFRTVALYLTNLPDPQQLSAMHFQEGARGSNVWLIVPEDSGVFAGARELNGICCVTPVQTYLDLKGQTERSQEAREELRRVHLNWKF